MVEVDRVHIGQLDEGVDVDRPRLARLHRGELLVRDDDLLSVEVVAVCDLLPEDLGILLRAEAPLLDAHLVLLMQLVEVVVDIAYRADHLDRNVHQAEAERPAPQRPGHQLFAFDLRVPSDRRLGRRLAGRPFGFTRLASRAAAISKPCNGSTF
jgi:hypothetical protein